MDFMPCNWTFWTFAPKRSKMWTSEAHEKLKVKVYMFISKFETNSQILSDSTNLRREVAYPNHYWIEWLWRTPEEGKLECQWRDTARIPGLKEMKTKFRGFIMIANVWTVKIVAGTLLNSFLVLSWPRFGLVDRVFG